MRLSPGRKAALAALGLVALGLTAARLDVPRRIGGVKGDEATYVAMAFSLAEDHDLKYTPEDYRRFRRLYGTGPEGIFLKRSFDLQFRLRAGEWPPIVVEKTPVPVTTELSYGKPYVYSAMAAPFAALMGLGGMLLFNGLLLALDVWCAALFCRARVGPRAGTLLGVAFVAAAVVPVYGVWLTPEVFNFSLCLIAYFFWLYREVALPDAPDWLRRPWLDWVAALLIGIATFSKPIHAPLIAPIAASFILQRRWGRAIASSAIFLAVAGGLYGVNGLVTGDWNYQGGGSGDRNYFVTHFPFDEAGTPFLSGSAMATNEANDQSILSAGYIAATLPKNILYFLIGRDAGLLPYYFPGALIAFLWLLRLPRSAAWQWLIAGGMVLATLALLLLAPDSWNGGGGPIGNRYFLGLYPALLFLTPAGIGMSAAVAAWLVGAVAIGPILIHPVASSRQPWLNPERWPLRLLPIELTILNDLPVRLNIQRWRVQVSRDPEVFLYYMDGRKYFEEPDGFWVAPGTAEIVVRTERPLTGLTVGIRSRIDNAVDVSIGGRSEHVDLKAGEQYRIQLHPNPGWYALRSYQVVWKITTARGFYPRQFDPAATDTRLLGAFISATYQVREK